MSMPKLLVILTVLIFGGIFTAAALKKSKAKMGTEQVIQVSSQETLELDIPDEEELIAAEARMEAEEVALQPKSEASKTTTVPSEPLVSEEDLPDANRIHELFSKRDPRLPIVQTISYKSRVPWQKGRSAWIADYASHYKTSRHFIARSLNGKPDYEKQDVAEGVRFNVFNDEKNFEFYLLIDVLLSKMWFYYIDNDTNEKVLINTYKVGLGRPDEYAESGTLTPLGIFSLGEKIAVYKPKTIGFYQGEKTEMVKTFGTRWIPFGEEIANCTAGAQGFGIHGLPLIPNEKGEYVESVDSIGKYESDGCIRMKTKDIEELFAIIITKPTTVELVKGFNNATLHKETMQ